MGTTRGFRAEELGGLPGQPKGSEDKPGVPEKDPDDREQTDLKLVTQLSMSRFRYSAAEAVEALYGSKVAQDKYTKELRMA
jgi:hypothetical protein